MGVFCHLSFHPGRNLVCSQPRYPHPPTIGFFGMATPTNGRGNPCSLNSSFHRLLDQCWPVWRVISDQTYGDWTDSFEVCSGPLGVVSLPKYLGRYFAVFFLDQHLFQPLFAPGRGIPENIQTRRGPCEATSQLGYFIGRDFLDLLLVQSPLLAAPESRRREH